jgi:hypothetical protein
MRDIDNMRNKWNRRMSGSILAPNPTGWLVDAAIRTIKYCKIKQNRKRL